MLPWRPRDRARYALLMRVHCSNGGGGNGGNSAEQRAINSSVPPEIFELLSVTALLPSPTPHRASPHALRDTMVGSRRRKS